MTIKFILILAAFIVASVLSDDYTEDAVYKQEHCIKITEEKEEQLKALVQDIGDFLNHLTMKYEDIDIRFVRFDIEGHSEDEIEEKEMILKVNINDCKEQGPPRNQIPNIEEPNKNNGQNDGHTGMEVQINDESDDVGDKTPKENQNYQKNDQEVYNGGNVIANSNTDNNGIGNHVNQRDDNKNFDNTYSQTQNQIPIEHEASAGCVNPYDGQPGDKNNQADGCGCYTETSTDVSAQRPTVTFLQFPENVQEMINFLESKKKKKIEPVWMYVLQEGDTKEFIVFQ